ncbi:ejaculatory bulb-specific protein 3-like [Chrysoperla carnea]|uniref:ejaculatory bulb-specific protein 3-like n=1 Tax=Chrysoperla carnea TaxID=189513 RepID=UPI001D0700B9|nr:ejaculatory bulb-specific protein 3-like [Chrysoperla carnea]
MKSFILAVFVIVACTTVSLADDDKYTSKYDNIDIDKILENDRLLKNYIACVDGSGKCTPDGEELKKHAKEAMDNCCEKCTDKQKETIKKVYKYLVENKADLLKDLREKFDPKGEYEEKCKGKFNIAEA